MVSYSSLYQILSLQDDASIEEIKSAFRKLALIYHPDINNNSPESEAKFKIIYNAYSILVDQVKRGEYDTYLRTSSILKNLKKKAHSRTSNVKAVFPKKSDSTYGPKETVFSHINFLLWEIEDFLRKNNMIDWNRQYSGKSLWQYVLKILTFIDKWVLDPAGYRDYFLEARKINRIDITNYIYDSFKPGRSGHRPFVNIMDYFYNIRKRMNRFLKHASASDLVKTIPDCEIRIIDCIFEAQNITIHYLCYLNQVLAGDSEYIPTFLHSNPCFDD